MIVTKTLRILVPGVVYRNGSDMDNRKGGFLQDHYLNYEVTCNLATSRLLLMARCRVHKAEATSGERCGPCGDWDWMSLVLDLPPEQC